MSQADLARRAKSLLDRLCEKPRFAGSAGEAAAREVCRRHLEAAGFTCREIPFEYSQWPAKWGPPLSAVLRAATIIIVARIAIERGPLDALAVGGAIVVMLLFIDAYAKRRGITDFPAGRARSVNLEATRGAPRVWLVAHLDSKSQTVPMLIRIGGSVALTMVMVLALALLLLAIAGVEGVRALWPAVQVAAVLAALPGVFCLVTNSSTGAVDNASGVVAVLLAAESAQSPRELGVLVTSGEELGLAGARVWATTASASARFLNCDTVDDRGDWRCMYTGSHPTALTGASLTAASSFGWRPRVGRLIPGIMADSIAFSDAGREAVTLSKGTLATLARIHTRRDNSSALTGTGAAEASAFLSALAKELV
jgi:peptidase M28-like protein